MGALSGAADRWSGMVALGSGIVVYIGPGATADLHRHDAIQIVWSPDRPVGVGTANGWLSLTQRSFPRESATISNRTVPRSASFSSSLRARSDSASTRSLGSGPISLTWPRPTSRPCRPRWTPR